MRRPLSPSALRVVAELRDKIRLDVLRFARKPEAPASLKAAAETVAEHLRNRTDEPLIERPGDRALLKAHERGLL